MARRVLVPTAALALALPLATLATGAGAQGRDLAELALLWAQGEFRAPIVCTIAGDAHRALRRLRITAGPRHATRPTARVVIDDLEAPPDTRCTDPTGREEPNVVGQVVLTFERGHARPDTASYDFQSTLRREGGFVYVIKAGRLRLGPPGGALVEHDLAGGEARLHLVEPGSDAARRLAEFGPRRKLRLELDAPEAPELVFELVQIDG